MYVGDTDSPTLATPPGHASYLVSVLTEDLLAKQSAVDQLQRAVLRAEGSSQMRQWQVQEMEKSNGALAADLSQLRKLLHEEKNSNKVFWYTPAICRQSMLVTRYGSYYCHNLISLAVLSVTTTQLMVWTVINSQAWCFCSISCRRSHAPCLLITHGGLIWTWVHDPCWGTLISLAEK